MADESSFSGQIVSIWSKEPGKGGVLENVCVRLLGQRAFLVGQLADDGKSSDPRTGAMFWFPVDDVIMLTVYPDLQAARAAYAAFDKRKQRWRFWA
jgi:hypothetical protein